MSDVFDLPQVGATISGKYRIERVLGTGGMSTVFEATNRMTDRRFALKWLRPEMAASEDAVRRFVREAKVAGRFKHPNVVEVYDFGQAFGSFYIVMELLEGESLEERLERVGRFSADEARRILVPCMRGVARAHAAGVIHRDIKPANIFLCRATEERPELPKVLDFGISRFTNLDVLRDSQVTEPGAWMGTPQYMSPEQVRGRTVDQRTDVYSFGAVLYELLSGEVAFDAVTVSDLMVKIATEEPRPLRELVPDIDPALVEITARAMARDPAARFPDLESMIGVLQAGAAFSRAAGSIGPAPSQPVATGGRRGKRMVVAALSAAALLGALALSWLLVHDRAAPRSAPAAQPRELVTAGAPSVAKVRAVERAAGAEGAKSAAGEAAANAPVANTAQDAAAAEPSAQREPPRAAPHRPRGKPATATRAGAEVHARPAAPADAESPPPAKPDLARAAATRVRSARARSGVTFALEDFLPQAAGTGEQARGNAPAPEGAGAQHAPQSSGDP